MNIYIKPDIEDKLRRYDGSMSGLINRLLADFFEKYPTAATGGYKIEDKAHETPTQNTPLPKNTNTPKPTGISGAQYNSYEEKSPTDSPMVDDLFASSLPDAKDIIQSNAEQVCCKNELQPCKHWVWDAQTGEGYKNSLSGRLMEVE